MASLTRGGVDLLAFGRQFPTLGRGRQPDVDLTPVLQALGAPLDGLTLAFATWNITMPAVLLVQWPHTAERFESARNAYIGLLATLCAWKTVSWRAGGGGGPGRKPTEGP